jgi:hypothetical protein
MCGEVPPASISVLGAGRSRGLCPTRTDAECGADDHEQRSNESERRSCAHVARIGRTACGRRSPGRVRSSLARPDVQFPTSAQRLASARPAHPCGWPPLGQSLSRARAGSCRQGPVRYRRVQCGNQPAGAMKSGGRGFRTYFRARASWQISFPQDTEAPPGGASVCCPSDPSRARELSGPFRVDRGSHLLGNQWCGR